MTPAATDLSDLRSALARSYPDQTLYARYAAARAGLAFEDLDGGTGLLFEVASARRRAVFGGGRCSSFPQNDSTAATLANDKYFASRLLERQGLATTGGDYFFLHERHTAFRPPGHERWDAQTALARLSGRAFVKPLTGSRGDFAAEVRGAAMLDQYMDQVGRHYDAIILQPVFAGDEYRLFVLDGAVLYCARKHPPELLGDGDLSLAELVRRRDADLTARGVSAGVAPVLTEADTAIPAPGERIILPGRMNLSAGGRMTFEEPPQRENAFELAVRAAAALGLAVAGVDLFADTQGGECVFTIIEINANPAIRFLETAGRADLIEAIWRSTFRHLGLIDV